MRIQRMVPMLLVSTLAYAAAYETFCKCDCETDYGIFVLSPEDNGSPLCSTCTQDFCLGKMTKTCKGEDDRANMIGVCFTRESLKDKLVVYGFIWLVFGMLAYILVQSYITKK